jgi:mono/diheme cytochrome c family protein
MSRKKSARRAQKEIPKRDYALWAFVGVVFVLGTMAGFFFRPRVQKNPAERDSDKMPTEELSFTKHIAPIIYANCAGCHRQGQSAPFELLSYADVKKHAADIVTVVSSGYMPPWPPEKGHGDFVGERRLSDVQIKMIRQWVEKGFQEGSVEDLPPLPEWKSDWHLGAPDLVVSMPEAYSLYSDGADVYRNFVIPVSISGSR